MLTKRQQLFVDNYSLSKNGSASAQAAGYSAKSAKVTASRLLTLPTVRAAIAEHERGAEKLLNITRETVIKALWTAFENAGSQSDPANMINACKALIAICGYNKPEYHQVELNVNASVDVSRLQRMSDSELMALIQ